uniref:Retrotransposon hot spot protein, RHS3 n=1 Tax=Trypanosoma brucei TaxID=5691 RepID=Q8WPQ6_9TRYP|nr:retrotransposon hot spot protein, RHS3 [Trypanosoma brucei]
MSRANSPAAPQGNNANPQVTGNVEGPMRRPRDENVPPPPAAAAAQPPQIRQGNEGGPNWTMDSEIEDVLLQRYEGLRNMKLHDFLDQYFSNTYDTQNVAMFLLVKNPRRYIIDSDLREEILGLDEFQLLRAVIYLPRNGIEDMQKWEERATAQIREFVGPVARGMLDAALDTAKEARERAAQTADGVGLKGLYESIYNAKWSYVMSGYDEEPLGMKVFNGKPQRIWTEEEVDITPEPANVDAEIEERPNGLEIFVLTSEKGWPYNRFALDYTTGRKAVFQHVYIRREIMRVWYIIQKDLKTWWVEKTAHRPPIHIVIGTPGIGKSCGLGSFLLHSLLHFHEGMLDVVAYFTDTIAYLIYNRKGDERGRVVQYEYLRAAVNAINKMKYKNRGHIIMDIRYAMQQLYIQLPSDVWGVTIFTSPNSVRFDEWTKNTGGRQIIINCDDVRDIEAFMVWEKLLIHTGEKVSNRRRHELRKEMEDEWRIVEGRINSIGLLPRYIFGLSCYEWRLKRVHDALETMKKSDEYSYNDIIEHTATWKNNEVTDKLVKVVRVKANVGFIELYSCQALSLMTRNMMMS